MDTLYRLYAIFSLRINVLFTHFQRNRQTTLKKGGAGNFTDSENVLSVTNMKVNTFEGYRYSCAKWKYMRNYIFRTLKKCSVRTSGNDVVLRRDSMKAILVTVFSKDIRYNMNT